VVVKLEGKRPLARPMHRWECIVNTRIDLKEIGWKGMDWIDLVQDMEMWWAVVKTVMGGIP
jgi:hypothetical protein